MDVAEVVAQLAQGKNWPAGAEELSPQVWIVPWKKEKRDSFTRFLLRAKNLWLRVIGKVEQQVNVDFKVVRDTAYEPYRITQAIYLKSGTLFEFYPKQEICDKHEFAQFQVYMGDVLVAYPDNVIQLGYDMALQIPLNGG